MQTKLTLRLEDTLIQRAKSYSKDRPVEITPIVRSLKGSLRGAEVDEGDYRRYLEEKYL